MSQLEHHQTHAGIVMFATWHPALVFAGAWMAGWLATWLSVLVLRRKGRLDAVTRRSTHVQPTPRAGALGIALLSSALVAWQPLFGIAVIAAAIGFYDDCFSSSAKWRLFLQLALMSVSSVYFLGFEDGVGPLVLIPAVIVMGAWSINAANFLDGRNGLLSGMMILHLLALPWLGLLDELSSLALAALWLGYLPFNFPRAQVFMGDVGSYLAGGTLAWLMLLAASKGVTHLLAFWVLAAPILADPSLTLAHRAVRKKRLSEAHREHLYQYLSRIGVNDVKLLCLFALYASLSIGLARYMIKLPALSALYLMLAFVVGSAWVWRSARAHAVRVHRKHLRSRAVSP